MGEVPEGDRKREGPVQGSGLLADGRCSQAVPDFLSTTDVGPAQPPAEDDAQSEASK